MRLRMLRLNLEDAEIIPSIGRACDPEAAKEIGCLKHLVRRKPARGRMSEESPVGRCPVESINHWEDFFPHHPQKELGFGRTALQDRVT